eukprot:s250_g23.t1
MADQLAERSHTSKCASAFALTEELRAIARDLRDACNLPNEQKQAALHKSAKQLDDAADAVGSMVKQLERSGGALPTHFVGVRMPVHVRRRLGYLQSEMLEREPRLQKAAVSMEKSHVTLLVAKLSFDDISTAAEALQRGAEAWRSERHGAVQVRAEGLGHFPQNGVLYTRLLPRDVFDSLRKHLMQAFAERGLALVDEMPDEAVASAEASAKSGDAPPADATEVAEASPKGEQEMEKEARAEDSAEPESEHQAPAPKGKKSGRKKKLPGEYLPHVTLFKSSQAGRGKSGQKAAKAAKQSIARVAKSLLGESTEKISFGSFSLEDCELLAMHHVQGDGYFEAQASARLRESLGEDAASQAEEEEEDEEFQKQARQILERIPEEADQKSPKKRKTKKKQTKKTNQKGLDSEEEQADAESEDSEGDTSEEEAPAKKSSAAQRGKLRKAAAAPAAKVSSKKKAAKKKAAPARPPSEEEEEEDDAADDFGQSQEDQRIDPEDGLAYTWSEFSEYYTGKYKKKVIEAYWNDCHLLPKKEVPQPKAAQKKARRRWFSRR